jgi:hypothetical protein
MIRREGCAAGEGIPFMIIACFPAAQQRVGVTVAPVLTHSLLFCYHTGLPIRHGGGDLKAGFVPALVARTD